MIDAVMSIRRKVIHVAELERDSEAGKVVIEAVAHRKTMTLTSTPSDPSQPSETWGGLLVEITDAGDGLMRVEWYYPIALVVH